MGVKNTGYPASLELHKTYRLILDADAAHDGGVRIADKIGDEYLYPSECLAAVALPWRIKSSLLRR